MAATEGVATSMTLSAISARVLMFVVASEQARTILTLGGSCCRKSSQRNVWLASAAWSPKSGYIQRRSWVGFPSPSSSPLMSCCNFCCSEAAVLLTSSVLSWS